ncbi:hypothetical protein NIIDMKKI_76520 [Mycobacterium kansasii]|uniref:Uncharacterized protein n=1 Tax=Mycobacterium kansasii TaxID=1768 RepID=A0A7G1IN86_MYCKA|nr:hypothetical protein NIIDMKKI_76520 [Mycobacterium kansasii]
MDFFDQLPQQRGHATNVDKAQQRVVRGAGDLITLRGAHHVGLMVTGMKEAIGRYRVAVPIQHLQLDRVIRMGRAPGTTSAMRIDCPNGNRTNASPVTQ